ncbi:MAG: hypothetical protein ACI30M_03505 [Muribaculaceae bacterium]
MPLLPHKATPYEYHKLSPNFLWVDYDHYQNTGEPDVFDEEDIDEIVDELNDWD